MASVAQHSGGPHNPCGLHLHALSEPKCALAESSATSQTLGETTASAQGLGRRPVDLYPSPRQGSFSKRTSSAKYPCASLYLLTSRAAKIIPAAGLPDLCTLAFSLCYQCGCN